MSSRTYRERVIVLRKTRLREADLVLTMLAADGRQVRAVAKGALKPTGSFASRLELYAESDVLLVEGRSLDIVKEARLVNGHAPLRFGYERSVCAAPMAELLAHATQDGLAVARLFPMTQAALDALERADNRGCVLLMTAFLLKASSLLGFRPSFMRCVECGRERPWECGAALSHAEGGILCPDCHAKRDGTPASAALLNWAHTLMHATFEEVLRAGPDRATTRGLAKLAQSWIQAHISPLKSLPLVLATVM